MNEEKRKILEHLIEYLQQKIDSGEHKIFYNDLMYDEKTIDCINAINNSLEEIERLNNKYNKALELLIDYNLPCEIDDFMNVHSDYCETHCGVDEEQYKRCWDKFIEWKLGSDKE